jgi:hypothetical protein
MPNWNTSQVHLSVQGMVDVLQHPSNQLGEIPKLCLAAGNRDLSLPAICWLLFLFWLLNHV